MALVRAVKRNQARFATTLVETVTTPTVFSAMQIKRSYAVAIASLKMAFAISAAPMGTRGTPPCAPRSRQTNVQVRRKWTLAFVTKNVAEEVRSTQIVMVQGVIRRAPPAKSLRKMIKAFATQDVGRVIKERGRSVGRRPRLATLHVAQVLPGTSGLVEW